jgi:hypothetical protein
VKLITGLVLGAVLGVPAGAATTPAGPFLCIVERATGFTFDPTTKSWHEANFQTGQKYIVKRTGGKLHEITPDTRWPDSGSWAVWNFGDDHYPAYTCQDDFSPYGVLWCGGTISEGSVGLNVNGTSFAFNLNNHRFITDVLDGYIQAGMPGYTVYGKPLPEGSTTPSISIGTCTAL